ncbi:MAG: hypothetical protein ACKO96_46600, partial [Flammeovirgaceae bacterium]
MGSYSLESVYQNTNYEDVRIKKPRVTVGTIVNTPNGIAYEILIIRLWKYYIQKNNDKVENQILELIRNEFKQDKPIVRDSILHCLGNASKEVLDKYWDSLVDNFITETLKQEYDYGTFFFVLILINRWLAKA